MGFGHEVVRLQGWIVRPLGEMVASAPLLSLHLILPSLPLVFNVLHKLVRNMYYPNYGIIIDVVLIYTREV